MISTVAVPDAFRMPTPKLIFVLTYMANTVPLVPLWNSTSPTMFMLPKTPRPMLILSAAVTVVLPLAVAIDRSAEPVIVTISASLNVALPSICRESAAIETVVNWPLLLSPCTCCAIAVLLNCNSKSPLNVNAELLIRLPDRYRLPYIPC